MKKEWLMTSIVIVLTLAASLSLLRSFAPKLLGIPVDLQMVKVLEEVPPFFENAFRPQDLQSREFIIRDPYSGVRAKPLVPNQGMVGPNDILGFRNHGVPNVADVVVIGDSQTYGNNSQIQLNWPGQMSAALNEWQDTVVYNMSVGGWGAVQYLYAATKAIVFQPRVMVIAFYTGNDPLDSFKIAYNYDVWKELIPDSSLSASDIPKVEFPAPDSELWKVKFNNGQSTTMSPTLRYASNMNHPAVNAGYAIMAKAAHMIASVGHQRGTQVAFTIIPTKELVYEERIIAENINPSQEYLDLVAAEVTNIEALKQEIKEIENASYIDVIGPLQAAALRSNNLYPRGSDGHPQTQGYRVIAEAITEAVQKMLPERVMGFAVLELGKGHYKPVLINNEGYWYFSGESDRSLIEKNGWVISEAPIITRREIADLEYAGEISDVQPDRFGPQTF